MSRVSGRMSQVAGRMLLISLYLVSCVLCPGLAQAAEGVATLETLLATERYADVITEADEQLARRLPSDEERPVRYLRGLALMKLGRWDEASETFRALMTGRSDRQTELAVLRMADVMLLRGELKGAGAQYGEFLNRYPQSAFRVQAYFGLAKTLLKAGTWDAARKQLDAIRTEYPESFEARWAKELLDDGLEFSVQVGSFRREEFAEDLADGLRAKGFDAYVKMYQQGNEEYYRVRVGHFRERAPAEAMERQLQGQGFVTRLVP